MTNSLALTFQSVINACEFRGPNSFAFELEMVLNSFYFTVFHMNLP